MSKVKVFSKLDLLKKMSKSIINEPFIAVKDGVETECNSINEAFELFVYNPKETLKKMKSPDFVLFSKTMEFEELEDFSILIFNDFHFDESKCVEAGYDYNEYLNRLLDDGIQFESLYLYIASLFYYLIGKGAKSVTIFKETDYELTIRGEIFSFLYTDITRRVPRLKEGAFTTEDYLLVNNINVGGSLFRYADFLKDIETEADDYGVYFNKGKPEYETMTAKYCRDRYDELIELSNKKGVAYKPEIKGFDDLSTDLQSVYWYVRPMELDPR